MSLKQHLFGNKYSKVIHIVFIVLVFCLPFISYSSIINPIKIGQQLFLVTIVSVWLCCTLFTFLNPNRFFLTRIDLILLGFLLYATVHYGLYSYYSFMYSEFWVFMGYPVLYYLFKIVYKKQKNSNIVFHISIIIIWLFALVQSIVGLLQYFNVFKADNPYFKVVGTYINPNFLGIHTMIGIVITIFLLLYMPVKNILLKMITMLGTLPMGYVLYITQSRASWVGLLTAILLFMLSNSTTIAWFKTNKNKTIAAVGVLLLSTIGLLYFLSSTDTGSIEGRALIRKITVSNIAEKPILGHGTFNFLSIYNTRKANYFLNNNKLWNEIKVGNYASMAYNDYLQILFEIGIIGLLLIGLLLFFIIKNITINPRTRLGLALLLSFCIMGFFTSILYNPNAMLYVMWALSVMVVYSREQPIMVSLNNNFFTKIIRVLIILGSIYLAFTFYIKTQMLADFKTNITSKTPSMYSISHKNTLGFVLDDPYIEFRIGIEKYYDGLTSQGLDMMESSIKKNPIPDAQIVLANLYVLQNNLIRAEALLQLNLGIEPYRFEPRNNLLHFYLQTHQNKKAKVIAQEIIKLPIKINTQKIKVYKNEARKILEELEN